MPTYEEDKASLQATIDTLNDEYYLLEQEFLKLKKELNEARREICRRIAWPNLGGSAKTEAKMRGWDCWDSCYDDN